ncbi:hypothetical protein F4553_003410 [Allocatelliglobosispora scoriae]|uniref:Uncharacterized protein n=1 Tax=Allocatelliglobosispora scoriae TaxID=643052 RepID=A0A841BTA9_9ACTN|nr:hypothetical protein [Allocatelliglobosispora scoriae]MBB5870031.1 hypothetical protein [Allocatelliglobosispora scoriae]
MISPLGTAAQSSSLEALRALGTARRSAVAQRVEVRGRMQVLILTAPEPLRSALRRHDDGELIAACAAGPPGAVAVGTAAGATRVALRFLARRHQQLSAEITQLDTLLALCTDGAGSPRKAHACGYAGRRTHMVC